MGILLSTLFILIGTGLGVLAGWWLHGNGSRSGSTTSQQPNQPHSLEKFVATPNAEVAETREESKDDSKTNASIVEVMMTRLRRLTATVAKDVGEHTTRVQAINQELNESENDGETVLLVLEKLIDANGAMQGQLQAAEDRLQEQTKQLDGYIKDARTDSLTRLANRRAFDDELDRCMELYQSDGVPFTVMMVDVDYFKRFNDTYGHQAGDAVLRGVARVLRRNVSSDDMVCRYGGEEFTVVFPGKKAQQCMQDAEAARAAVSARRFQVESEQVSVTTSAGLAQIESGETSDELMKRADDALYYSKQVGRDCSHLQCGKTFQLIEHSSGSSDTGKQPRIRGVSDRKTFEDTTRRHLEAVKRGREKIAVMLVEIDQFDQLERANGKETGSIVQRATAQFLRASMRETDNVALYDNYTFALLITDAGLEETTSIAERVRSAIARCSLPVKGSEVRFTVSVGASMAATEDNVDGLLKRAEQELLDAADGGGNEVRIAASVSSC